MFSSTNYLNYFYAKKYGIYIARGWRLLGGDCVEIILCWRFSLFAICSCNSGQSWAKIKNFSNHLKKCIQSFICLIHLCHLLNLKK
ncbi:unnamed protein product [Meloidogyne enterolobii]|uniref:Uncharacterized protein n=1 Tax=Meloidogyne enterolobii TaxID=390850 RepID=A0ACB0XWU3_MELEN